MSTTAIMPSRITFFSDGGNGSVFYTLTGSGNITSINRNTQLIIMLSDSDVQALRFDPILTKGQASTFIRLLTGAFEDIAMNPVENTSIVQVVTYATDITPPMLEDYAIDINRGLLVLTFDERVDAATVDPAEAIIFAHNGTITNSLDMYSLTGGTQVSGNSHELVLRLSAADLNVLMSRDNIAQSRETTYLSFSRDFVSDLAGVAVNPVVRAQVTNFTGDTTRPFLRAFIFNVSSGILTLEFSEYVRVQSFDVTQITLINTNDTSINATSFTLNGGDILPSTSIQEISISLLSTDLDIIKDNGMLATSEQNLFLIATERTVTDGFGQPLIPRTIDDPLLVSDHIGDNRSPILLDFVLDLNIGTLTLTFDEIVNETSFDVTRVRLIGETNTMYDLTNGTIVHPSLPVIVIEMVREDLDNIKADSNLATSLENTAVLPRSNLVSDTANNVLQEPSIPIPASSYIRDSNPPFLESFVLNLDIDRLILSFNETVDSLAINVEDIYLQQARNTTNVISLAGSQILSMPGPVIEIIIGYSAITEIKRIRSLAVSRRTTWISFNETAFNDMSGNPVVAIDRMAAKRAADFIDDATNPTLISYALDLNSNTLTLTFTETVDSFTVNFTSITLSSSNGLSPTTFTLTGGSVVPMVDDPVITIQFTFDDINSITSLRDLASSATTTFLTFGNGTILDMADNEVIGVSLLQLDAIDFTFDTTPPELVSFDLISNGTEPLEVILRFSETVSVNSLNPFGSSITFHLSNISNTSSDSTLTGGDKTMVDTPNVTIFISNSDLGIIQSLAPLATFPNMTFLSLSASSVRDVSDIPIAAQGPIQVSLYNADLSRPTVDQFSLDMNNGELSLTFSEPVQYMTFDVTRVTLQDSANGGLNVMLNGTSHLQTMQDGTVMTVIISNDDLNAIKRIPSLAVPDSSSTYLVLSPAVLDIASNLVIEITSNAALLVTRYTPDTSPPLLLEFDLDMVNALLTLRFNETVNASSINPERIQFVNMDLQYSLTGGSSNSLYNNEVIFTLTPTDHNVIKALDDLAVTINNTLINLLSNAILDMNRNPNSIVRTLPVTNFVKDSGDPSLTAYDVNMNVGSLTLTFDETVNVSSLVISDVTLNDGMGMTYSLNTSGVNHGPRPAVIINISDHDLNEIKRLRICLMMTTCFLTFPDTLIEDMVRRSVVPLSVPRPVDDHTADTTGPELIDFTEFDLISRQIILEFSETIDIASFDPTQVNLRSFFESDPATVSYQLNNVNVLSTDSTTLIFELTQDDVFAIKNVEGLCDIRSHCYIVLTNSTISDTSGNSNLEVLQQSPGRVVTRFINDRIRPVLNSFNLDMNNGLLQLIFSEPMQVEELRASGLTLLSMPNASIFEQYSLTGGSALSMNGAFDITFQLSVSDLNALKATTFTKSSNNTYLAIQSSAITDVAFNQNPVVNRDVSNPLQVSNYTVDSTSPVLQSFQLDLSSDQLIFTFDEPILTQRVVFSRLTLQNDSLLPLFSRTLVTGTVLTPELASRTVAVRIDQQDVAVIKLMDELGTNANNTFLSVEANAFVDTAGNGIENLMGLQASFLSRDTERVQFIGFTIDMQTGELSMEFNDIVLANSFDAAAIAIQDNMLSSRLMTVQLSSLSYTNSSDGYVILVMIHPLDLLRIKSIPGLAINRNTTWLTFQAFGINGAVGEDVLAVTNGNAIQVREGGFTADTFAPEVENFLLDLNQGSLNVTFTDTVDHRSLNVSLLTIVSNRFGSTSLQLQDNGVDRSMDGRTVSIYFTENDLNILKNDSTIGTSSTNTFLVIRPLAIRDLAGNFLQEVMLSSAIPASRVVPDTSGPMLRGFDLDLNAGELRVTFSEPVDSSTVRTLGYTLQSKSDATFFLNEQYTLVTGVATSPNGPVVTITFLEEDLNGIFAVTALGNTIGDTYLIISNESVRDISQNPAVPIEFTAGVQANVVLPDTNAPRLLSYILDMDIGLLSLSFSEVVLTSSVRFDQFVLQSEVNGSLPTAVFITLSGGQVQDVESKYLNITFSSTDLTRLQSNLQIATSTANSFLSFTNLSLTDTQIFPVIPQSFENARPVTSFIPDTTPPTLLSFEFDLNSGNLTLSFNEVVNRSLVLVRSVILRNNASRPVTFPLVGSIGDTGFGTELELYIGGQNLNDIKANTELATSIQDTFLQLLSNVIPDANSNFYTDSTLVYQVGRFVPDTTDPVLENFDLDMNSGVLTLYFSETVNIQSLDVRHIALQSMEVFGPGSSSVSLTSDSIPLTTMNDPIIRVMLSSVDLNNIKSQDGLATDRNDTYLTITSIAIVDMVNRTVDSIFSTGARRVSLFTPDARGPEINGFSLDLNLGTLSITFDEYVNETSTDLTQVTLRSSQNQVSSEFYTLTNTASRVSFTGTIVVFQLSAADQNAIKARRMLAISNTTTFLEATANAVRDMSNNLLVPIPAARADPVDVYIADITPPSLTINSFDLNVNTQAITLHFNETIDAMSIQLNQIALHQTGNNANNSLSLSNGTISPDSADIVITLSQADLNELSRLGICTAMINCFISFSTSAFTDMAGNPVVSVNESEARQVGVFTVDSTPPRLLEFSMFNLNEGQITLSFSETVQVGTVRLDQLSLDQFTSTDFSRFTLSNDGRILGADRDIITIQLTPNDLINLKRTGGVCFNQFSCWVRFTSNFIRDITNNAIIEVPVRTTDLLTQSQTFIPDTTPPMLQAFDIDLNRGEMLLVFDEPIRNTVIDSNLQELTLSNSSDAQSSLTLSGGLSLTSIDGTEFRFRLDSDDLNAIKANTDLATTMNNTFLNFTTDLVSDVSTTPNRFGNPVNSTPVIESLLQVRTYIRDAMRPRLVVFSVLDMDEGFMELEFNEAVEISVFNPRTLNLQSSPLAANPAPTHFFVGGIPSYLNTIKTRVRIDFSAEDLLAIKTLNGLAESVMTSHISLGAGVIQDTAANDINIITPGMSLTVITYQADVSSPVLTRFTLDMDDGVISMTFNDVMDNQNIVDATRVTMNGVQDGSDLSNRYTLTGGTTSSPNGYETRLNLIVRDLNEIKKRSGLATSVSDTYISITAEFIRDVATQPVMAIINSNSFQAANFTPDTTDPTLDQFYFDADSGTLTLLFSETVNTSSINLTAISLQNRISDLAARSFRLSGGDVLVNTNEALFSVRLDREDLNTIKTFTDLATTISDTFLTIGVGAVLDINDNELVQISGFNALPASNHTPDTTPPVILNFTLNLDRDILVLTVSESVDSTAVLPMHITIQSAMSVSDPDQFVRLINGGTVRTARSTVQTIQLMNDDLNVIKARTSLAISQQTTYISLTTSTLSDFNGIPVEVISPTAALQSVGFVPDSTPPALMSFRLLIGADQLILTFSETVNTQSLEPTLFTLISSRNTSNLISFQFTGSRAVSENSSIVTVDLEIDDLNSIKRFPELGTSLDNTFLIHNDSAVEDMNRNPIRAISIANSIMATEVTSDSVSPSLQSFTLDLSNDRLTLFFSETVSRGNLNVRQIVIQNSAQIGSVYYRLTGGTIPSGNNHIIVISLDRRDANEIKQLTGLATMETNTFISFTSLLVTDLNSNPVNEVLNSTGMPVTTFIPDERNPIVESFNFLLDETSIPPVSLVLTFSETVQASSLVDIRNIVLQPNQSSMNASERYPLTFATSTSSNSAVVTFTLGLQDYRAIQQRPPLGRTRETTWLSIGSAAVLDMANNPLNAILTNDSLQVSLYTADLNPPMISGYSLDLDDGALTLSWNEPVNSTTDFTHISLLSDVSNSTSVSLTSGEVMVISDVILRLIISEDNLNAIFADNRLATSASNTYIYLERGVLSDINLNPNDQQGPLAIAAENYRQDISRPSLNQFSFDLNRGVVTLVFSETVNASNIQPTEITFQDDSSNPNELYTLTGGTPLPNIAPTVILNLSVADINNIKALTGLAVSNDTTFVSFGSDLIVDMNDNRVNSIPTSNAQVAVMFIPDQERPTLMFFSFDLNEGLLTLSFDESVNVTSIDIQALTLQAGTVRYSLNDSVVTQSQGSEVVINLSSNDLNNIKNNHDLCTDSLADDCYLSFS